MIEEEPKTRKKGGIRGAFQTLLDKLASYLEVMIVYVQKNLQVIVRKMLWIVFRGSLSIFLILFSLLYLSYSLFLTLQTYVFGGNPIFASGLTGLILMFFAFLFLMGSSTKE